MNIEACRSQMTCKVARSPKEYGRLQSLSANTWQSLPRRRLTYPLHMPRKECRRSFGIPGAKRGKDSTVVSVGRRFPL